MKISSTLLSWLVFGLILAFNVSSNAQQFQVEISGYLKSAQSRWNLTDDDITHYMVSDQYTGQSTGITYTYLHQQVAGIRIFGAVSTMAIRNNTVVHFANRFIGNAAPKTNATTPLLTQEAGISAAVQYLGLVLNEQPALLSKKDDLLQWTYESPAIARENIGVELVYLPVDETLRLAWDISIAVRGSTDWWNIRIDALTGAFLEKNNWTQSCDFGHGIPATDSKVLHSQIACQEDHEPVNQAGSYNVFPLPLEAPSFGQRVTLTDPNSPVASPFGWHDTDGVAGAEYTITRGNNVHAYEDADDDNEAGYSPEGGNSLNFDFPLDLSQAPETNQDAIITNLFYMNNMLHDILYQHGFDEVSGNFQEENYGNGGEGTDYVRAEAQDGGGTNNANFSTPPDGNRGRMQMYLWGGGGVSTLTVNSPAAIAGDYVSIEAAFGPGINAVITSDIVLALDAVAPVTDGCEPFINSAGMQGKIVLIDRGTCTFLSKVQAAEDAGAIAVVIINNIPGDAIPMGGSGVTNIPSVMISLADGELIKSQVALGLTVNMTLAPPVNTSVNLDGSLDNGIITHEFGHGLSNRLTGGPSNSNCLSNGEQGGEGWSDFLALILTIEPDDQGTDGRGIGTYALGQATIQVGIRRYRYSTDMSINPQTYADLTLSAQVHDIGEIWCQSLWDMTWNLINAEGFDPDWYNGTGGNNTALRLVIEGMKLQPCNPGYIDGRDAILAADSLLYNNAHRCLIWEAFTKRGMGLNASQGDNDIAGDETPDFTLPVLCFNPVQAPVAVFSVNPGSSCFGYFEFTDLSTDIPQFWEWDFGDGNTSNEQNPVHIYENSGLYTATLTVTNVFGSDAYQVDIHYTDLPVPVVTGLTNICQGATTILSAQVESGNTARWSVNGSEIFEGTVFNTPPLLTSTTFSVRQVVPTAIGQVGPLNNDFGTGGNQATSFEGRLLFEAIVPFRLISVLVYAQGAGDRIFTLYDENNEVLQTATVNVPDGESRVVINFEIPCPGNYSIGNVGQNLYRNNTGASYPYILDNIVHIYSSNAASNALAFYYYFYDWEVQESPCSSAPTESTVTVIPGPLAAFSFTIDGLNVSFVDGATGNPVTWSWDFGDGSPVVTTQNPVHTYQQLGVYTVSLTVSDNNCTHTYSQTFDLASPEATGNPAGSFEVTLYPNPTGDLLNIDIKRTGTDPIDLELVDVKGRILYSKRFDNINSPVSLDMQPFAEGVYFVNITCAEGTVIRRVLKFMY